MSRALDVAGRTVIVTGAGSGIGRATSVALADAGVDVIAADVDGDGLARLEEGTGGSVRYLVGDVVEQDYVDELVAMAAGRLDGLVNNVGIMDGFFPVHEVTDEVWDRVMAVNVTAMTRLCRAVVPRMMERRSGAIVNVASEAALRGSTAGVAYTASKHAVVGLTVSCAHQYAPFGIRVNAVAPGPVSTGIPAPVLSEMARERGAAMRPLLEQYRGQPEQLASVISWLLSDGADYLTGVVLPCDGGWSVL